MKLNYINNGLFDKVHKNKPGFVIGGGPSILDLTSNGFDFNKLKDKITIGTNKAYKLLTPTYLLWMDNYFWRNFKDEIKKVDCIKFCPDHIVKKEKITDKNIYAVRRDSGQGCDIRNLPETLTGKVSFWNNSGVAALRLAYIMGCRPIYLVGIDLLKKDLKGRERFHNDYEKTRNGKVGVSRYQQFLKSFEVTVRSIRNKRVRVYSCSPISPLNDIVPFVDLREVV